MHTIMHYWYLLDEFVELLSDCRQVHQGFNRRNRLANISAVKNANMHASGLVMDDIRSASVRHTSGTICIKLSVPISSATCLLSTDFHPSYNRYAWSQTDLITYKCFGYYVDTLEKISTPGY